MDRAPWRTTSACPPRRVRRARDPCPRRPATVSRSPAGPPPARGEPPRAADASPLGRARSAVSPCGPASTSIEGLDSWWSDGRVFVVDGESISSAAQARIGAVLVKLFAGLTGLAGRFRGGKNDVLH